MMKSLNDIKDFIEEEELVENVDWDWSSKYIDALEPIWKATKRLQEEQFPLCDLYKLWMNLKRRFELSQCSLQKRIFEAMVDREHLLLNNITLLSSVYLDPRLNLLLKSSEKSLAKTNLKQLAKRIHDMKKVSNI